MSTMHAENAAKKASSKKSSLVRVAAALVVSAFVSSAASLADAAEQNSKTASINVSVTVLANCSVEMHGASAIGAAPEHDVSCAGAPYAMVEKDPRILTAEDGSSYVVTTVQF